MEMAIEKMTDEELGELVVKLENEQVRRVVDELRSYDINGIIAELQLIEAYYGIDIRNKVIRGLAQHYCMEDLAYIVMMSPRHVRRIVYGR